MPFFRRGPENLSRPLGGRRGQENYLGTWCRWTRESSPPAPSAEIVKLMSNIFWFLCASLGLIFTPISSFCSTFFTSTVFSTLSDFVKLQRKSNNNNNKIYQAEEKVKVKGYLRYRAKTEIGGALIPITTPPS